MSSIKDKKDELARQHEAMLREMQGLGGDDASPTQRLAMSHERMWVVIRQVIAL